MLGAVPATDPVTLPTDDAVTERVLRVLDARARTRGRPGTWW